MITNLEVNELLYECVDVDSQKFADDKCKARQVLTFFNRCYNCNCCIRHQINKPRHWEAIERYPINYNSTNEYNCECACRHASRLICYFHPNQSN
jgi:hypothetical protein